MIVGRCDGRRGRLAGRSSANSTPLIEIAVVLPVNRRSSTAGLGSTAIRACPSVCWGRLTDMPELSESVNRGAWR